METLERWQQKKDQIRSKLNTQLELTNEEKLIPLHDVVIEVLSGASAGGMTAAVLAYSFNDNSYYNRQEGKLSETDYTSVNKFDRPSKLYRTWIDMVDDNCGSTFKKLMDPKDVAPLQEMKSILNSKPIDDIAANAIPETINFKPPSYVSEFVSIILSVTNLEGVPIDIRFSNIDKEDPTCNVFKIHSGFLHYQFKEQALNIDYPAEIITEETKEHLAAAAKATGAFPFGLSNRKIVVRRKFFEKYKTKLKESYKIDVNLTLQEGQDYVFNAVDGGAINNEPIGTTVRILECKKNDYYPNDENYLILIDPFPTITNAVKRQEYFEPRDYSLLEQASKLIGAIRNQSMYRQEDLLDGLEMDKNRFLIAPAKRKHYFLASGLIEGFAGFFKKEFRCHDYQLGRKNCQTFLRFYFGEERKKYDEITGTNLSEEQFRKWKYDANYGKENEQPLWKIPIIPDMLLHDNSDEALINSSKEMLTPRYNGLTVDEFNESVKLIQTRFEAILDKSYPSLIFQAESIHKIVALVLKLFPRFFKRKITNRVYKALSSYLHQIFSPQSVKQEELMASYLQLILKENKKYKKTKGVRARSAKGGEMIVSYTKVGKEGWNIASEGDYIVRNGTTAGEEYILKPAKFNQRYKYIQDDYYFPKEEAKVYALQISIENIYKYELRKLIPLIDNPSTDFFIEPVWDESQLTKLNDYLVTPLEAKDEIYRIAQQEFEETYQLVL
jgi:hypothetical protein